MLSILSQRMMKYSMTFISKIAKDKDLVKLNAKSEYYFGYGANLSVKRFHDKYMNVEELGNGELKDHQINFELPTEFVGKGYASVNEQEGSSVYGRVFKISPLSLILLGIMEWVPFQFYDRVKRDLYCNGEVLKDVNVYIASHPKKDLRPSEKYLELMIKESTKHGFPQEYIDQLSAAESGTEFPQDPGFCLSNTGKRRWFEKGLASLYLKHDQIREFIASRLP